MTTATDYFKVLTLDDFAWPISYRFTHWLPWGKTQQVLTVDAPPLVNNPGASAAFGLELWRRVVAVATTGGCQLAAWETMTWKDSLAPAINVPPVTTGLLAGDALRRADTPVCMLCTSHGDDLDYRRIYLAGAPKRWVSDRKVTVGARDALEAWGTTLVLGLLKDVVSSPCELLIAYPELLVAQIGNPLGVAFRRVTHIVSMEYTARAPDLSSDPWP